MEGDEEMYKNLCRLCLSSEESNKLVSLIENDTATGISCYGESVKRFAQITIEKDDKLPKNMCQKCLYLLKCAIYFKFKCESSEKVLKQWIDTEVNRERKQGTSEKRKYQDSSFKEYFSLKNHDDSSSSTRNCELTENSDKILQKNDENDDSNSSFVDDSFLIENHQDSNINMAPDDSGDILDIIEHNPIAMSTNTSRNKQNIPVKLKSFLTEHHQDSDINMTQDDSSDVLHIIENNPIAMSTNTSKNKQNIPVKLKLKRIPRKKGEKFVCEVCNKVLANQLTYDQHIQYHYGCKYICEHCGKGFPVLSRLQMHLVNLHGTGPYLPCQYCLYKAPRLISLTEHQRLHTGERPYTCEKCGMTFRRRAIWKKHLIHHSEKTVQCSMCPRKFYTVADLKAHANNIHERVYMYSCHKCDATYAKTETVRKHLLERHGIPRDMQGKIVRINRGKPSNVVEP